MANTCDLRHWSVLPTQCHTIVGIPRKITISRIIQVEPDILVFRSQALYAKTHIQTFYQIKKKKYMTKWFHWKTI